MRLYKYSGPVIDKYSKRVRCNSFVAFTHAASTEESLVNFKSQYCKMYGLNISRSPIQLKEKYVYY